MRRKLVRGADGKISFIDLPDTPEYFFPIGNSERELVADWFKLQKGATGSQEWFLKRVKTALEVVTYDYSIATIEPSEDANGKIYYEVDKPVLVGLSYNEWFKKAREFMPKRGSDLATRHELFMWYAYRIAKGYWTIEYVCDNSSSAGNYWNAPNAKHDLEPSGARTVGGFADGVGNTRKLVKSGIDCLLYGGEYLRSGEYIPVAIGYPYYGNYNYKCDYGSGCIVLKK